MLMLFIDRSKDEEFEERKKKFFLERTYLDRMYKQRMYGIYICQCYLSIHLLRKDVEFEEEKKIFFGGGGLRKHVW